MSKSREVIIYMESEDIAKSDLHVVEELVRCKDCIYGSKDKYSDYVYCVTNTCHGSNWFCADGRKRSIENV